MPVSELTQLQFLVLAKIGAVERRGREIRDALAGEGYSKSSPAFYQLMGRMEDADLIKGSNHRVLVGGHSVVERRYKVTAAGLKAANDARRFYLTHGIALPNAAGRVHP